MSKDYNAYKVNSVLDMLDAIGIEAENRIDSAKSAEEYAFYLGHINIAAALTYANKKHVKQFKFNMCYDAVKRDYENAKKHVLANQISMKDYAEQEHLQELIDQLEHLKARLINVKHNTSKKGSSKKSKE